MKELIFEYRKQIIIGLLIILGLLVLFVAFKPKGLKITDSIFVDEEVEDNEEYDESEAEDSALLELANALYEEATTIYSMNPYCGINYDDIDEDRIEDINGDKYYISNFTNLKEIDNKIKEVFENNSIVTKNTIMKDGFVYCKYNKPFTSSSYLGTYLSIVSYSGKQVVLNAVSTYIKPVHSELCNINKPLECKSSDKQTENNKFIIVNINNSWKVREFHLPH